jgi:hypothetical protein
VREEGKAREAGRSKKGFKGSHHHFQRLQAAGLGARGEGLKEQMA